jgi:circadian clock protein KaiB
LGSIYVLLPWRRQPSKLNTRKDVQKEKMSMKKKTDQIAVFEKALEQDENAHYVFRLYISGTSPRSMHAVQNLNKICIDYLDSKYEIEVIDINQEPGAAGDDEIIATPTLVKELPKPLKKFIGDLSNLKQVLEGLAIKSKN